MADDRAVLHVDMDAFFAAVEQLDRPELRGRPVLVGSPHARGVVAAASYEARPFGCHSAQPMAVARRRCRHAVVVPARGRRYRELSDRVFAIFERFTPRVEAVSVDEAFLDVTGTAPLHGPPREVAAAIKREIRTSLSLTASVGIGPNKFLAKLASDLDKPDGLVEFTAETVETHLPTLSVEKIRGIGPVTARRLRGAGLATIGDIRRAGEARMRRLLGEEGEHLFQLAHGVDERPVVPESERKQVGQEQTFPEDLPDPADVRAVLLEQTEHVGHRLRARGERAAAVTVKIRFGDFRTITRSASLAAPTDTTSVLWERARSLFDAWAADHFQPVRLIGVSASGLTTTRGQLGLFDESERKQRAVDAVTDRIAERFGRHSIRRGGTLPNRDRR